VCAPPFNSKPETPQGAGRQERVVEWGERVFLTVIVLPQKPAAKPLTSAYFANFYR
jgi:hypothetical protein